jgi:hypothetical protein
MTRAEMQWLEIFPAFYAAWWACGLDLLAKRL